MISTASLYTNSHIIQLYASDLSQVYGVAPNTIMYHLRKLEKQKDKI